MAPSGCFNILVTITLMITSETHAKTKTSAVTYKPCSDGDKINHCLQLKCKRKNHLIFDLDVIAGSDGCLGMTSELIVNRLNCFWSSKCMFRFPMQRMLMGLFSDEETTVNRNCLYEKPEKIIVQKLRCAEKEEILDICGTNVMQNQGIIRSHARYPWHYAQPDNAAHTCNITHDLKKGQTLHVTVLHANLVEGDSLTINGRSVNETNYSFTDNTIVFSFTKVPPELSENWNEEKGQGFVVCFLAVKSDDKSIGKSFDACEQLVKNTKSKGSISEIGPTTKKCYKLTGKRRKKKPSKKSYKRKRQRCCCNDYTCEADLEDAERFSKQIANMKQKYKGCKTIFR